MAEDTAVDPPEDLLANTEETGALADAPKLDQRAHTRVNVHWQGAVILNGQPVFGRITDLSRGGLSFMCELPLALNTQMSVYIRMPNADRTRFYELETVCKVANTILVASQGLYRIGMRVIEMRGNAETMLTQYLTLHGG